MKNNSLQIITDLIKSGWTKIFDQKQIRLEIENWLNHTNPIIDQKIDQPKSKITFLTVSWVEISENGIDVLFEFKTQNNISGSANLCLDYNENLNIIKIQKTN